MTVAIIDYGLGNVLAFANVYRRLNLPCTVARSADELAGATKVILPGVGAFDHAVERLEASGMKPTLVELVHTRKVPLLGVCVGMQLLARSSDEGTRAGLELIPGRVRGFRDWPPAARLPMPHMGWNDVTPRAGERLFAGLERDARFYFLHSFFFEAERADDTAATATYGGEFTCAVHADNVYGVQFHPEKSHHYGAALLKNFAEL